MSLGSAAEVIEIIKSGKYENAVNAKRGVGRTHLSQSEKSKVLKFIDEHFGTNGSTSSGGQGLRPGKRMAKVAKKKRVGKKVARRAAPAPEDYEEEALTEETEEAEEETPTPRPKKKTAAREKGTLGISPSEVKTVADLLQVVDSTVSRSVRVVEALKAANEVSSTGDIGEGIRHVKQALEGAAVLLHNQVVVPLLNSHQGTDPNVQARLEQVVAASSAGVAPEQSPLG